MTGFWGWRIFDGLDEFRKVDFWHGGYARACGFFLVVGPCSFNDFVQCDIWKEALQE
jgi:hypothetical protein